MSLRARTWAGCAAPSHAACLSKADANRQKIPFPFLKNHGGANHKKYAKGFFWQGAARLGVLGGGAELRHFAGNRFELRCKNGPI